jgi:hypothetical protein
MNPRNILLRTVQGLGIAVAFVVACGILLFLYDKWFEMVVTGLINMGNMGYVR